MKILVAATTNHTTQDRMNAALDTWVKDINPPHDYAFIGSTEQSKTIEKCWDCSPKKGEHRDRLPEKLLKGLKKSLEYEWDFLYKCDDDTYVNFKNLEKFLKTKVGAKNFIASRRCWPICKNADRQKTFKQMADANKIKLPKGFFDDFTWAQGGAGIVLSRDLTEKLVSPQHERLFMFDPVGEKGESEKDIQERLRPWLLADDFVIALAAYFEGAKVQSGNGLLINPSRNFWENELDDTISSDEFISIHHCDADTLRNIYKKLA